LAALTAITLAYADRASRGAARGVLCGAGAVLRVKRVFASVHGTASEREGNLSRFNTHSFRWSES